MEGHEFDTEIPELNGLLRRIGRLGTEGNGIEIPTKNDPAKLALATLDAVVRGERSEGEIEGGASRGE
jgi:hypothetical protein